MMFFEEYMHLDNGIIQYAIAFVFAIILIGCHNWLLGGGKPNPFKRSAMNLSLAERVIFYAVLFIGTVSLMLVITTLSRFSFDGAIAIGVASISSFFIIFTFNGLLGKMRENKLSLKFLIDQNFLLTAYLIIFTELSFLNWVKEIETYVQKPFLIFILSYAVLIVCIGIFLGIPKKHEDKEVKLSDWRFTAVIFLDPLIVGVLISIFVKLTLDIILLIQ